MNPQQMMMAQGQQMPPEMEAREPSIEEQEVERSCEGCEYWVPDEDPARGGECDKVHDSEQFSIIEGALRTAPDFFCSEFEPVSEDAAEEAPVEGSPEASPEAVRAVLERLMNAKKVG